MSKLEELIKEFCPNGVECKSLLELVDIHKGIQFNKKDMAKEGLYPVINGGIAPSGYIENYNEQENTITISQGGASAGYVNWLLTKFWAGAHCYVVKPLNNGILDNRYLFHFIKNNESILKQCQYGAGIPALAKSTIQELQIPLPALPVQREIVRILDSFTLYSAELTAELTARRKQYEFYRDKLLNFESDSVEWKPIEELFPLIRNGFVGTVTPYFTDKANGVRYLEGTNIHNAVISDNEELYVTKEFHKKHIRNELKADDILMVQSGHIGDCAVVGEKYAGANCHALIIMSNGGACSSKFYVHYFHTYSGFKSLAPAITGGTIQHVLAGKIGKIKVPVPPIDVQERIVKVLDNFDAICSDLGIGLPAEIEKRQKQYEYYREKLLTFDGKYATILTERNGT